jgi:hypothetical protein
MYTGASMRPSSGLCVARASLTVGISSLGHAEDRVR